MGWIGERFGVLLDIETNKGNEMKIEKLDKGHYVIDKKYNLKKLTFFVDPVWELKIINGEKLGSFNTKKEAIEFLKQ